MADPKKKHVAVRSALNGPLAKPLTCLKRDRIGPNGQQKGSYTCDPIEMDGIAKRAWNAIYDGNVKDGDLTRHVHKFLGRYGHLLCNQPEAETGELDWQQLKASCVNGKFSVGGLDSFTLADFSMLSDTAFQWLADMLNRIEMGAAWPE